MRSFREHGVMLYLDKAEYVGFIKCQADKGLGRSYAGKLCFIEGQYRLGYLSQEEYKARAKKYSQPLNAEVPSAEQLAGIAEQRKLEATLETTLTGALKEWDKLPTRVQDFHLKTASAHNTLPIAVQILQKRNHALVKGACQVLNRES